VGPHQDDALAPEACANLFERSAVPVLLIDHERRAILRANRAALTMLGLEASDVVGRPATDLLVEPSIDHQERVRALRGEETAAIRQVPTPVGPRTVELNIVASGTDGIVLVELHDLSSLLEAAVRAEAAQEELASTSAALRTVAARLAHDLRGPMTAISGFADALLDDSRGLDDAQRTHLLGRISANAHALATMADSILSEADAGPPRPEDASLAVADLFSSVRGVTEAQIEAARGELRTTAHVAALPVPVGRVRQAVINLVSNSIKYRDPARPLLIELEVRHDGDGTVISVRDNGRGLPPDTAALFDAGTRGPASEGTAGAGLGLAFVRAAVESMRGTVVARPRREGAEVLIQLPIRSDEGAGRPDSPVPGDERTRLTGPQLARVIDASPVATFVIDISARQIVAVNRASIDLLGLEEREILGRPGAEFVDEHDVAEGLRRRVMADPDARHPVRTRLRAATGELPALVWVTAVDGTALAVAQAVPLSEVAATDGGSPGSG
jgi:PAS domain S-box-containing protein